MMQEPIYSSPSSSTRTSTTSNGSSMESPTSGMSSYSIGRYPRRPTHLFQKSSCQLPSCNWTHPARNTKQRGVILLLTRIGMILVAVGILHNYWMSRPRLLPWHYHRMVMAGTTMATTRKVSSEGRNSSSSLPLLVVEPKDDQISLLNATTQNDSNGRYGSIPFDTFFLKPIALPTIQQDKQKTGSTVLSPLKRHDDSLVHNRNRSNKKEMPKQANNLSWTSIPNFANHPPTTNDDTTTTNDDRVPPNCTTTWMTLDSSHTTMKSTKNSPDDEDYTYAPVLVPSFPGSGTELFRNLIRTMLPGFAAASIFEADQCRGVKTATCKTHWPVTYQQRPRKWVGAKNDIDDDDNNNETRRTSTTTRTTTLSPAPERRPFANFSVVLLRNPQTAIPSWFNALYETRHDQKAHSEQAPEEAWNEWRDAHFFTMAMPLWKQFVQAWSNTSTTTTTTTATVRSNNSSNNSNTSHVRPLHSYDSYDTLPHLPKAGAIDFQFQTNLYLPYEDMINVGRGPDLMRRLANELHRSHFPVPTMTNTTTTGTASDQQDDGNDIKISSERMQTLQNTSIQSSLSLLYDCWWKSVVQDRPTVKRRHHYEPRFTLPQLTGMLNVVGELIVYCRRIRTRLKRRCETQ
jgi:hypothetical protein